MAETLMDLLTTYGNACELAASAHCADAKADWAVHTDRRDESRAEIKRRLARIRDAVCAQTGQRIGDILDGAA